MAAASLGDCRTLLLTVVTVLAGEVLGAVGIVLVVSGRDGICAEENIAVAALLPGPRLPSPAAQSLGSQQPRNPPRRESGAVCS